jgi:hypothetical protein
MPLFLHLFSFVQNKIEQGRIASRLFYCLMRFGQADVYEWLSRDYMKLWAGWWFARNRWS